MPKPQKGRKLTDEQRLEIAREVCEMYATDKYTIAACLSANGIESESTWRKWQDEIAEIADLYKKAIEEKGKAYWAGLVVRARTTLEKSLDGYTIELIESEGEEYTDVDGNRKIRTKKVRKKQIHIRPSIQAAIFILTNKDGENFQYRPEPPTEKRQDEKLLADWTDEEIEAELKRWKDDD